MPNLPPTVSISLQCKKCRDCFTIYWHLDELKEELESEKEADYDPETNKKSWTVCSYYETHPDGNFFLVFHHIETFDFANYLQNIMIIVNEDEYWCKSCNSWQSVIYRGQILPLKMDRFLLDKQEAKIYDKGKLSFTDKDGLMLIHDPRLISATYYAS